MTMPAINTLKPKITKQLNIFARIVWETLFGMATILNIETSTEVCSVSVSENGSTLFSRESMEGLKHSELLTVFIQELFNQNGLKMSKLDAIAVSKGPGSYTGLRIGVSVAKGLCYALDLPLLAIGSLDVLASQATQNIKEYVSFRDYDNILLCPMIDARRMEVYTSLYDLDCRPVRPVTAEIIVADSFSEFLKTNPVLFFGNGAKKCSSLIIHHHAIFKGPAKTSARFMQIPAEKRFEEKAFENVAYFEPFYLKDFVATVPKNKIIS